MKPGEELGVLGHCWGGRCLALENGAVAVGLALLLLVPALERAQICCCGWMEGWGRGLAHGSGRACRAQL